MQKRRVAKDTPTDPLIIISIIIIIPKAAAMVEAKRERNVSVSLLPPRLQVSDGSSHPDGGWQPGSPTVPYYSEGDRVSHPRCWLS